MKKTRHHHGSQDTPPSTSKSSALQGALLAWLLLAWTPAWALLPLPPSDLGELHVTPPAIATSTPSKVTATLRIPSSVQAERGQPQAITLNRLDDETQRKIAILATFNDDGSHGDEVPNDGLYTAQATLNIQKSGDIQLAAIATFQGPDSDALLSTLEVSLQVRDAVDQVGPWAVVDGDKVVFRDQDGATVDEERAGKEAGAARGSHRKGMTSAPAKPLFTPVHAVTSRDKRHIATIGSLHPRTVSAAEGAEPRAPIGWEFRYQDLAGIQWTKVLDTPYRHFFTSGNSRLLSEDGARVVVLAVGENDEEPRLWVYDQYGALLLDEKPALDALLEAHLSTNGRYLLLKGLPPTPTADMVQLIAIDLDEPSTRWRERYHGAQVTQESIYDNKAGGFDIVINGTTRYRFPRKGAPQGIRTAALACWPASQPRCLPQQTMRSSAQQAIPLPPHPTRLRRPPDRKAASSVHAMRPRPAPGTGIDVRQQAA